MTPVPHTPLLTNEDITRLIAYRSISVEHPWVTESLRAIDGHLRGMCQSVTQATGAKSRVEWDHYGSGTASFVDAWFYLPTADFRPSLAPRRDEEGYMGLTILLSRLSHYFVFMETEKHWSLASGTASSGLPHSSAVDRLTSPGVVALARLAQIALERRGMRRVLREQLAQPLVPELAVPTLLSDRSQWTQFDALFYWTD